VRDFQAKGVASVLTNNGKCWLTGSLLNNTNYDGTLYFLTAEHGIYGSGGNLEIGDTAKWIFLWNFVSSTCAGTLNNNPPSTYGAILVSVNDDTDMALLRLIDPPQKVLPNGVVFYNGWDRKLTQNSSGAMIHHPSGDVKKIATFNVAPTISGNFWRVSSFISTLNGYSIPEGGSSGAPVFNNKMQVIGNHYQSSSANCSNPIQEFSRSGAIGVSWDNGTIPSEILQPWLDPFNIDLISIDGEFLYTCGRPTYVYNVTVNSTRTDYGCTIISKNTTVNSSSLTFDAEKFTILESNFEVKSGAIFEIKTH